MICKNNREIIKKIHNDSGLTLLTGQKSPQCELNKEKIDKVKKVFKKNK